MGPIKQMPLAGAPALHSFFVGWVSANDKWSACTEEEMGNNVASQ
jgi:hypothetical protein